MISSINLAIVRTVTLEVGSIFFGRALSAQGIRAFVNAKTVWVGAASQPALPGE